ncbi:MAG: hypothetical protein JNJ83_20765 [Verrucomicrobiaceae bacterium]|nr:hypothetical protein [Verrucomicrobiaceae bacterium]
MKMIRLFSLLPVIAMTALHPVSLRADILPSRAESSPTLARNDARKIAVKFRAQGYAIAPVAAGDNKHSTLEFVFEVNKGVDYVLMVGIDEAIGAVDLYVKDESGNMIAQDTRDLSRACVEFASSYSGTVTIVVDPLKNDPRFTKLGHFALLVGMQNAGF